MNKIESQINPMRLAIIGSCNFSHLHWITLFMKELSDKKVIIVSGGAKGVDEFSVQMAKILKLPFNEYIPDYNKHGRYDAPKIRNTEIVENSDAGIAFWDGQSGGTADTVNKFRKSGKPYCIVDESKHQSLPLSAIEWFKDVYHE